MSGYRVKGNSRVLACVAVAALLSACDTPGIEKLKELCERDGRAVVYQQPSAAGYYTDVQSCRVSMRYIMVTAYTFVECKVAGSHEWDPIPIDGLYRIEEVDVDSGKCSPSIWKAWKKYIDIRDFYQSGRCFYAEPIEKPKARYGLFQGETTVIELDNIFGSKIARLYHYIKDLETGRLVADDYSYHLFPTPNLSMSSFSPMEGCQSLTETKLWGMRSIHRYVKP